MTYRNVLAQALICTAIVAPTFSHAKDLKDHPRREEVNERVSKEERRIREGVKDGSITKAQAKEMRAKLKGVKAEEKAEAQADGGHITKPEQKQLNKELNQDSKQIFEEKHPRRAEVNQRIDNQDKRIDAGVKDGQLTEKQASELKGEEAGVKAEERAEVKANGGHLTKGEKKQLNQELNQDSKQIHTERQDGQ